MKIVKIILVGVLFLTASKAVSAQTVKKTNNEAEVVFLVSVDCHSCEQKVMRSIPFERGVRDVSTNLEKRLVTVKYQPNRTDVAKLKRAIEKLGFTCEEFKPET